MLYSNILETVGNTPIVKLNKIGPKNVNIYVKIESFNPMGSVKDRLACSVIKQAELDGTLKPGQTVIEATSGNTGIGLAMVCAQKDYPLVVTMAESFSVERRRMMRFLGAKVVLTPASQKGSGMLAKAVELAENTTGFLSDSSKMKPMLTLTRKPRRRRFWRTSPIESWTTGSAVSERAAHSKGFPVSSRKRARKPRSLFVNPTILRFSAAAFRRTGLTMVRHVTVTLCFAHTSCKAGVQTLFLSSPKTSWTRNSLMASSPSTEMMR